MPSLSDTLIPTPDNLMPPLSPILQAPPAQVIAQPVIFNSFMRCPLPPIWQANSDSVRQFYTSGVPQTRIYAKSIVR